MPGEIATFLLGAQGGDEDAFARLYAATNPVLVRYLRSIGVDDAAGVALASWPTLLHRLPACTADDDDWFELAVGAARETATAGGSPALGTTAPSSPAPSSPAPPNPGQAAAGASPSDASPDATTTAPGADPVDTGVAVLQACGRDCADVLAMAVVAGLGRDSMARLTGEEPTAVLELVRRGQYRLTLPLEELYAAMAAPARPDELADAAVVQGLFGDESRGAAAAVVPGVPAGAAAAAGPAAVAPVTLTPVAGASLTEPSVVDLLTWQTPAAGPTLVRPVPPRGTREASRGARAGAGAAAWVIALGGVGAAAAMSGLLPAVVDNLFRGPVNRPVVTAQGPVVPGPTASGGGPTVTPPGVEPTKPGTQPGEPPVGGGTVEPVGLSGTGTGSTVVISTAAFTTPAGGGTNPAGGSSGGPAGSATPPPATSGGGTVIGGGTVTGGGTTTGGPVTGSGKPIPGTANGHTPAKTDAAAAKAQAKAAAAAARAQAKAAKAAAKARAQADKAAKAKAAKAKAAKAKAAKVKAAKAKTAQAKAAKAKTSKAGTQTQGKKKA